MYKQLKRKCIFSTKLATFISLLAIILNVMADHSPDLVTTKLEDVKFDLATFQSHNQNVVENPYGIFVAYSYSVDPSGKGTWRLVRSIDGGQSFGTLMRGAGSAYPPAIETDRAGRVYLFYSNPHSNNGTDDAYMLRFDPENNFSSPANQSIIPGGSASKFSTYYDEWRDQLYYFTFVDGQNDTPNFFTVGTEGNSLAAISLIEPTEDYSVTHQYPHIVMAGSTVYALWTTSEIGRKDCFRDPGYCYLSIQAIKSEDGGKSWVHPITEAPLNIPVAAEGDGSLQLSLEEERFVDTWLSSTIYKNGFLLGAYHAKSRGQHVFRIDTFSGNKGDAFPQWRADDISLSGLDGFFATDDFSQNVYAASHVSGEEKVGVVGTADLGNSWQYVASSSTYQGLYGVSGSRRLSRNGQLLGSFTSANQSVEEPYSVYFFSALAEDRDLKWIRTPLLNISDAMADSGFSYTVSLSIEHGGDSLEALDYSQLRVYENGILLGPGHSLHEDIRQLGMGRYSHWGNVLYFSSADNTNPNLNGRYYEVEYPVISKNAVQYGRIDSSAVDHENNNAFVAVQDFGTRPDEGSAPSISRLRIYEDGVELGPAHSLDETIRTSGGGAYSHWLDNDGNVVLYFSSSDNTDPTINGRIYSYAIEKTGSVDTCGPLRVEDGSHDTGNAYWINQNFWFPSDDQPPYNSSPLKIFENGVELGPPHSLHSDIRAEGHGLFSHWQGQLLMSSSDNSNPANNGRIYSYAGCGN